MPKDFTQEQMEPILDWGLQRSMSEPTLAETVAHEVSKQIAEYAMQSDVLNQSCLQCFADVASLQSQVDALWQSGPKPRVVGASVGQALSGTDCRQSGESGKDGLGLADDNEADNDEFSDRQRVAALEAALSRLTSCFFAQQRAAAGAEVVQPWTYGEDEELPSENIPGESAVPMTPLVPPGIIVAPGAGGITQEPHEPNLLFQSIESGDEQFAIKALDRATLVDVNARDGAGMTALHHAALKGMEALCVRLLSSQDFSEVNARDVSGRTALHRCAESGLAGACQTLLDNASFLKASAKDSAFGWTALHCAAAGGHTVACQTLLSHPLFTEVNAKNRRGRSALHCSSLAGHAESSWVLLEHSRFSEANSKDSSGSTVLHCASAEGHINVCRAFLEHPRFTSVNARNSNGCTALHCAASSGQVETCALLLEHPRFNVAAARNARGRAALDVAVGEARQVLRRTFRRQRQGGPHEWAVGVHELPEGQDFMSHDQFAPMHVML